MHKLYLPMNAIVFRRFFCFLSQLCLYFAIVSVCSPTGMLHGAVWVLASGTMVRQRQLQLTSWLSQERGTTGHENAGPSDGRTPEVVVIDDDSHGNDDTSDTSEANQPDMLQV